MKPGTQADIVREFGCSRTAISKLVKAKDYRIIYTPGKKINIDATVKALKDSGFGKRSKKLNPRSKSKTHPGIDTSIIETEPTNGESKDFDPTKPLTLEDDRTLIEKHKAFHQSEKERILNEIKLGNYYEKSEINEASFNLFRRLRDIFEELELVADRCRDTKTSHEARKLYRDAYHEKLMSIVNGYNLDDESVKKKIMLLLT